MKADAGRWRRFVSLVFVNQFAVRARVYGLLVYSDSDRGESAVCGQHRITNTALKLRFSVTARMATYTVYTDVFVRLPGVRDFDMFWFFFSFWRSIRSAAVVSQ